MPSDCVCTVPRMNILLPDKVGGIVVERDHVPYLGEESLLSVPRKGALHTTEGSFESADSEFKTKFAPNALLGRDAKKKLRLIEYAGIGVMAHALFNESGGVETNRVVHYQVEIAGFRQLDQEILLSPDMGQLDPQFRQVLAALMEIVAQRGGVPLQRGGDGTRSLSNWKNHAGWFGHVEVPENDHTDPGKHQYAKDFAIALADDTQFRVVLMDGEGHQLAQSRTFIRGQLAARLDTILKSFSDEIRPELWNDRDCVLRLKKA